MTQNLGKVLIFLGSTMICAAMNKFGCSFINNKYELDSRLGKNPVYGKPIEGLSLTSLIDIQDVLTDLHEAIVDVIAKYPFNTVDTFLEFYSHWNISSKSEDFYNNYTPQFQPHSPAVGLPIDLLDKIVSSMSTKWSTISNHVFLAAVQDNVTFTEDELNSLNYKKYIQSTKGKRVDRVLGILKLKIYNQIGYFLIQPYAGMINPILVMNNVGKVKSQGNEITMTSGRTVKFEVLKSNQKFILLQSEEENKKTKSIFLDQFIHIGNPYCSYLNFAQKIDLLKRDRYLIKISDQGHYKGGFYFSILPPPQGESMKNYKTGALEMFVRINDRKRKIRKFEFERLLLLKENKKAFHPRELNTIWNVNSLLGYKNNTLENGLLPMIGEMMTDQHFLNMIYTVGERELGPSPNKKFSGNFIVNELKKVVCCDRF